MYYVLSIHDASLLEEKTIMILLIIGFIIPILGVVSLYLLRHEAKKYALKRQDKKMFI